MPAEWKTVRVFISSTFRDMHAERDHLVKVVFPALRERLERHRIHLDDIDLRWGVTRDQAENDQVLALCLAEIERCKPYFLGLLGERYGWTPVTLPPDALARFPWIADAGGRSVTELEVLHGVLNTPTLCGRAFFYLRDPASLAAVPEPIRCRVYAETDPDLAARLADLKGRIRASGRPVMDPYPARWDARAHDRPSRSDGRLVGLEAFGERVRDQLWEAIRAEHDLPDAPAVPTAGDPLAEEADSHERFMESRLRVHVPRGPLSDALLAFAAGGDAVACLVTGPAGSGKSACLARFVADHRRTHPETLVVPHFVGAGPRSTDLRDVLRRLCHVFKARFGFPDDVPDEAAQLAVAFREFVGRVPADARALVVIDALDQLDETDRARELSWLPAAFPPHVKVVVSCVSDPGDTEPALAALGRRELRRVRVPTLTDAEQRRIIREVPSLSAKTLDEGQVRLLASNPAAANPLFLLVALEELRGFAPYERLDERIAAFPRDGDAVTALFGQVIDRLAEEFDPRLVERVLTSLAAARRGLSERELQDLVAGLDGAGDLFAVLRQLRPYLLRRAGLIDFYHRNLFKAVRERYLAAPEQRRQAHARLAGYFAGQDFWLESLEDQQSRADTLPPTPRPANVRKADELPWQLLQAADWDGCERLLTDLPFLEAKAEAGMGFELAADFAAAVAALPGDRPALRLLRLLEEALRRDVHFVARHPTTLFQCLWNSCWWYDCPEAARHYDLANRTEEGPLPWERTGPRLSALLERWREEKEARTPGFIWLRSRRPPPVPLGRPRNVVLSGHTDHVCSVAFSPDDTRVATGSHDATIRVWDLATGAELLRLRGDLVHDPRMPSIRRPEMIGGDVHFSPDGRRIVSCGDRAVHLWDAGDGTRLRTFRGHDHSVFAAAFSPDGTRIVSGSADDTVRVWDAESRAELLRLRGHESFVCSVGFSADGGRIVSGSNDKTVRVWDAASGRVLLCLRGHQDRAWSVAFSPDGRRIASSATDKSTRVWDAANGTELLCLRTPESVHHVRFSPDSGRVLAGSDREIVRVWDAESGAELERVRGRGAGWCSTSFSRRGTRVVCAAYDYTVHVEDVDRGGEVLALRGHEATVTCAVYSPDGRRIVTGSRDCTVRVWDAESGVERLCLRGHQAGVYGVSYLPDGRIASGSGYPDEGPRVWDGDSGECLGVLRGKEAKEVGGYFYRAVTFIGRPRPRLSVYVGSLEVVLKVAGSDELLAVFPGKFDPVAWPDSGHSWAGCSGDYLCIFALEGPDFD